MSVLKNLYGPVFPEATAWSWRVGGAGSAARPYLRMKYPRDDDNIKGQVEKLQQLWQAA